jgi:phage/plasmid-like protein (TIGR03299 family)
MSAETIEWLNTNTMIGFTKNREQYQHMGWGLGWDEARQENRAWWATDGFNNGYEGAIPVEEVERVLFNWEPIETEIMHKRRDGINESNCDAIDGNGPFIWVPSDKFKGIMHPDTEYEFGIFGIESYKIHSYKTWLVDNLASLVDGDVGIGTAGLLRSGGVAYVSVELPENVNVAGFEFRPMLMAATSVDGTKSTTYKMVDQVPVCDNTLDLALQHGEGGMFKVRHSSKSLGRLGDARDALGIIYQHAEDMEQFLSELVDVDVTDAQFNAIVKQIKPIPEAETGIKGGKSVVTNQRAITIAENTQQDLRSLWHSDPRVTPWTGTLLGAFQATNTWHNHMRSNSDNGVERVMTSTLANNVAKFDREFFQIVKDMDEINVPDSLASLV